MNFGLSKIVDTIFYRYDRDRSGFLDMNQLGGFLNDVFRMAKIPITVSPWQASLLMKVLDKNRDGRIDRTELAMLVGNVSAAGSTDRYLNNNNYNMNSYGNNMNSYGNNMYGGNNGYSIITMGIITMGLATTTMTTTITITTITIIITMDTIIGQEDGFDIYI